MNVLPLLASASLFASVVLAQVPPAPTPARDPAPATCTQIVAYPLETCPITGRKLGSMGAPTQIVLDGTLVQLCCAGCTSKAEAGKIEIVARIRDAAFQKQNATPSTVCAVTGEPLAANAGVPLMLGTRLVRVKDQAAVNAIQKEPTRFLAKVAPLASVAKGAAGSCCAGESAAAPAAKAGCCCGAAGATKPAGEASKPGCCEEATPGEKPAPKPAGADAKKNR